MSIDIRILSELFDEFDNLPESPLPHPTFMEISGYPYRENVYTNILRFYFDSEECHGLQDLFLHSILNLLGKDSNQNTISVETEISTSDSKRIDLVIETSSYLIGIENKVFAEIDNPFASYTKYLNSHSKYNELEVIKVILCLNDDAILNIPDNKLCGFEAITYEQLFGEIKKDIGNYMIQAQTKYLTMLFDFMETVENIERGSSMDKALLEFIKEKQESIKDLFCEIDAFKKELRLKVQSLGSSIKYGENVKQWNYKPQKELFETLVHDITLPDENIIAIDTNIDVNGWNIEIFNRKGGNMATLKEILDSAGIDVKDSRRHKNSRYSYIKEFDYEGETKEDLRDTLQEIVNKLSKTL